MEVPGEIGRLALRVLGATVGAGVTGLLGLCVYRLFLHPYAKYPGPLLAKLTSWYAVYHVCLGDTHVDIWRCHQKYGNVIRYGPNRIAINTPAGMKAIYSHGKNAQKAKSYLSYSLVKGAVSLLTMVNRHQHGKNRRILNQGLSDAHIRAADPDLKRLATVFADGVGESSERFGESREWNVDENDGWSAPKNMAHWSDYFTFDVMSKFVFGMSYGLMTTAANHWLMDVTSAYARRLGFLNYMPEMEDLKLDNIFFPGVLPKAMRYSMKSKEIMEMTQARQKAEKESGEEKSRPRDLFSTLLTAKDPETGEDMPQAQLWADSNMLILAGSDTSSTGIAAAFFYLSQDPVAYDRLCREVRAAFSSPEEVCQGPKLSSCVYLRACVQESIRLTPPGAGAMWREVLPGGLPLTGSSAKIPAGCEVGTCVFAINHNEDAFPEPFAFRPERWIPAEAGEEAVAKAKASFFSFSIGPRNCPGKALSMVEMMIAVAAVLTRYDFRRAPGKLGLVGHGKGELKGSYYCQDTFTAIKDGPYIQFKPLAI